MPLEVIVITHQTLERGVLVISCAPKFGRSIQFRSPPSLDDGSSCEALMNLPAQIDA